MRFPDGRTTGPLGWLQAGPALQRVRQHLAAVGHCRARPASGHGIWSSTAHCFASRAGACVAVMELSCFCWLHSGPQSGAGTSHSPRQCHEQCSGLLPGGAGDKKELRGEQTSWHCRSRDRIGCALPQSTCLLPALHPALPAWMLGPGGPVLPLTLGEAGAQLPQEQQNCRAGIPSAMADLSQGRPQS